jgi:rhodanese-related sulfurtransferase
MRRQYPDVPTIAADALHAWLADPARESPLLLDFRSADEQAITTLPGAQCVRDTTSARRAVRENTPGPVVVYCAVGVRSARLARTLLRDGVRVFNLEESIFGWANRGYPLVHDHGPAARVHPFDDKWAVLLDPERRAKLVA